jgi:hypothetical protein
MPAKRADGVRIERAADEILALKVGTPEAHALNQTASIVFDLCDGTVSKAEMAREVQRRTGLPADEQIVELALADLADAGLIDLDEAEPPATVTRRSLVRRLSLAAAAVAMLPVVETILAPPASAAGSSEAPLPPSPISPPMAPP